MTRKTAHIHIGTDGAAPKLATAVMRDLARRNRAKGFHFVDDGEFGKVLRGAIGAADHSAARASVMDLSASSDTLLFSRPKFMYAGQPLNFPGALEKSVYKLTFFQSILQDFDVILHLLVTDHVTYLASHADVLEKTHPTDVLPSWLPFVSGLQKKLAENCEMIIWNAEHPEQVAAELYASICGEPVEKIDVTAALQDGNKKRAAEQVVIDAGWDLELLDDLYEQDLKVILHGEG
ncbi:hypothetical protein [Paracoccus onubensis]|nr:hypothetical protein [Paracoccus onubensis]